MRLSKNDILHLFNLVSRLVVIADFRSTTSALVYHISVGDISVYAILYSPFNSIASLNEKSQHIVHASNVANTRF